MMQTFNVIVYHYSVSMTTFKPILRTYTDEVQLEDSLVLPKDFDTRLLDAASNGRSLDAEFKDDFAWQRVLSYSIKSDIVAKLGKIGKNASRILLEVSPGIYTAVVSTVGPTISKNLFTLSEIMQFQD